MEVQAWKKGGSLTAPPETVAGEWESRKAYLRPPWSILPQVSILDREAAIRKHKESTADIQMYADGSAYRGILELD
jgi:hypothetical protein